VASTRSRRDRCGRRRHIKGDHHVQIGVEVAIELGLITPSSVSENSWTPPDRCSREGAGRLGHGEEPPARRVYGHHVQISNLGMFGIEEITAINDPAPPRSAKYKSIECPQKGVAGKFLNLPGSSGTR
jgi:hypothetical protein